jgi:3-ketosteroid 9alpha-monooxygenase subunit B
VSGETYAQQHHHYHRLRVARVVEETADARSFVIEIPDDKKELFAYLAGQYLTFRVPFEGRELVRCYSLSSSPVCDDEHKVTVKRIADGRISNWMNDRLAAGSEVDVLPPAGRFVLREGETQTPMLLFAGGSGITPVISLIKTALATTGRRMKLVYANRDEASIIFREELEALRQANPERLEVVHSLDDRDGFLDSERAARFAAETREAEFYLCGPGAFMEVVERGLEAADVPRPQVFKEVFVSPEEDEPDEEDLARAAAADAGSTGCETLVVTLEGKTVELPYEPGKTVLESARGAGLEPPFSCEDGYCSCCMAKLVEGQVEMRKNDCLTDRDLEDGWRLTCQSVPQSRVVKVDWDAS